MKTKKLDKKELAFIIHLTVFATDIKYLKCPENKKTIRHHPIK